MENLDNGFNAMNDLLNEVINPNPITEENKTTNSTAEGEETNSSESGTGVSEDVVNKILSSFDSIDEPPIIPSTQEALSVQPTPTDVDDNEDKQFVLTTSESDYYLIVNEYHKLGFKNDQDFLLMLINERTSTPTYQKWLKENMPAEYLEAEKANTEGVKQQAQKEPENKESQSGSDNKTTEIPKSEPKNEAEARYTPPPTKEDGFKFDLSKVNWWVVGGVVAVGLLIWYAYKKLSNISIPVSDGSANHNLNGGSKTQNMTKNTASKAMAKIGLNTEGLEI